MDEEHPNLHSGEIISVILLINDQPTKLQNQGLVAISHWRLDARTYLMTISTSDQIVDPCKLIMVSTAFHVGNLQIIRGEGEDDGNISSNKSSHCGRFFIQN